MLRKHVMDSKEIAPDGFRWRGNEPSRVEGFSDAVFAFAITLLVVSLEVPKTFDELLTTMRGFAAFGVCFLLLYTLWHEHYIYFRRYGLHDRATIWLNALLLFVMLFFVYPLKFLFGLGINAMVGIDTRVLLASGQIVDPIGPGQWQPLMMIYGGGYVAVYAVFAWMYTRAFKSGEALNLNPLETWLTRMSLVTHLTNVGIGLLVVMVAFVLHESAGLAGFLFFLIGPARFVVEGVKHRGMRELRPTSAVLQPGADS